MFILGSRYFQLFLLVELHWRLLPRPLSIGKMSAPCLVPSRGRGEVTWWDLEREVLVM